MENSLACQICLTKCKRMFDFKVHVRSTEHIKKMKEVFQKDTFKTSGLFPTIIVMNRDAKQDVQHPIIGLSLLTVAFSPDMPIVIYLCHVCEEKCPSNKVMHHLSSGDHSINYFNYTNPNMLRFSWIPCKDMRISVAPGTTWEINQKGERLLKMLDLPEHLLQKYITSSYSEVMGSLSENDKYIKQLGVVMPKRTKIQDYRKDANRKHPLLGLQHIVECICVGQTEKRYYICTLCKLTLKTYMVIKHVLSFDHVYCYFKAWHPYTLPSKESHKDCDNFFKTKMLDLAKQTEQIYGKTEIKQLSLEPDVFTSVNFSSYAEALRKLESIAKEKGSSLMTNIKPGKKLEYFPGSVSSSSSSASYSLRCQNCNFNFANGPLYLKHVKSGKHKMMMRKFTAKAEGADVYEHPANVWQANLKFYNYLTESLAQNRPVIGASLVVTCLSTAVQAEPVYVCFACQDCFLESFLSQHMSSQKHLVYTLMYQNPWRLPFAWQSLPELFVLTEQGQEEEQGRGPNQRTVKILDIPSWMLSSLHPPSYQRVMERLSLHHTLLRRDVPPCETYSKLQQNDRFPLLGRQFLVMHDMCVRRHQPNEMGFLCLLCQKRLTDDECCPHVFSWEHVISFLFITWLNQPASDCPASLQPLDLLPGAGPSKERFHPGSLSPNVNREVLLDLAKQSARVHPISPIQVIKLDKPIWEPCTYKKAIIILKSAKWREGRGALEPQIVPKTKLVPRVQKNSPENSRKVDTSQKKTVQTSADKSETVPTKTSVAVEPGITSKQRAESGGNAETTAAKDESEIKREPVSEAGSEGTNKGGKMLVTIKGEPVERTIKTEVTPKSCQTKANDDGEEKQLSKSSEDSLSQKTTVNKECERKRLRSSSDKSPDECPHETVTGATGHKRQRLSSGEDAAIEETIPSSGQQEATTADTAQRRPSALGEHHCDQRGPSCCERLPLKIPEKDIVSHVPEFGAQMMHLAVVKMEIDDDSENSEAQPLTITAVVSESCLKVPPEASEDTKRTQINAPEAADGCPTASRRGEDASDLQQATTGTRTTHPDTRGTNVSAEVTSSLTVTQSNKTSSSQISVAAATSIGSTPTKSKVTAKTSLSTPDAPNMSAAGPKHKEPASVCPATPSKTTAASSKVTSTTPTLDVTITSPTPSTRSAALSTPGARPTSYKPAPHTVSTVTPEATCRTAPASKHSATPLKTFERQTSVPSAATAEVSNKCQTTEVTAKKNSDAQVEPLKQKSSPTATEASHITAGNATSGRPQEVGLNQLIKVCCNRRRQVFCQLCCIKLKRSSHPASYSHQYNYVKLKFPEWTAKPSELESKLRKIVAHLAEIERDVGARGTQTMEVTNDVYDELAALPVDQAVQRLKVMIQRNMLVTFSPCSTSPSSFSSPSSFNGMAECFEQELPLINFNGYYGPHQYSFELDVEVEAPDEVTSTDSNMEKPRFCVRPPATDSESAGTNDKIEQEPPEDRQQMTVGDAETEMELDDPETPEDGEEQEIGDPDLKDTPINLIGSQRKSLAALFGADLHSSSAPEQKNLLGPDQRTERSPNDSGCGPGPQTSNAEKPPVSAGPPAKDATGTLAQKAETDQETAEGRQHMEIRDPDLKDVQIQLESTQRRSLSVPSGPDLCSSAAPEQQHPLGPSQNTDHAPKDSGYRPEHGQHTASQVLPRTYKGEVTRGCSRLSGFLRLKGHGNEPILGLSSVWECRGLNIKPFYVCESCRETLALRDICTHMVSAEHQLKYKEISHRLSAPEHLARKDAQGVLLEEELYYYIQKAPFNEALNMLRTIRTERKVSFLCRNVGPPQQKEAEQKTQERVSEAASVVEDPYDVKRVSNPRDVIGVDSKAVSVDPSCPGARTCLRPQETYTNSPMQVEPPIAPADSVDPSCSGAPKSLRHQETRRNISFEQAPPIAQVSPTGGTTPVFPQNEWIPTRNRPAVDYVETLVTPITNNHQPDDPLPARCAGSWLQHTSQSGPESAFESTSVNPAGSPADLSPTDQGAGPGSDLQHESIVDLAEFRELKALLYLRRSKIKVHPACMTNLSNSEEKILDSESAPNTSKVKESRTRWDQKYKRVEGSVEDNSPRTTSLAAALLVNENQRVNSNTNFANNSSHEDLSTTCNLSDNSVESKAAGSMLPTAVPANPSALKPQGSSSVHDMFGNVTMLQPMQGNGDVATNQNLAQVPQPEGNKETNRAVVCLYPFQAIMPPPTNQQFTRGYEEQTPTNTNKAYQVTNRIPVVTTAGPTLPPSGGYGPIRQIAYVTQSAYPTHSAYPPSEAAACYTASQQPPVSTVYVNQREGYPSMPFYPRQVYPEQQANQYCYIPFGQQLLQQQMIYSSWANAAQTADVKVTKDAAYSCSVPSTTPANPAHPQVFLDLNQMIPAQNSHMVTHAQFSQLHGNHQNV